MSHCFFYLQACLIFFLSSEAGAQKKWDGGGNDGQWNNPLNWDNNVLPAPTDAIVLDNSVTPSSYIVLLPAGAIAVTVRSIGITPSAGTIELVLPAGNTQVPALVITGPGYGLDIGRGGIFRNSSGAPSGTPVSVSDSIRISNGGRYIHNTARAHAANVQVLSTAPGTEQGTMEFDVPDVSSTISLSGRTYGNLTLSAGAVPGAALKYTAAGTNGVRIRHEFSISAGVTCGLNFSDTVSVGGDFTEAGTLDLGNTARSTVLSIKGNITQAVTGVITESGTGIQQLLLEGNGAQTMQLDGSISNEVTFVVNTRGSVSLLSSCLLPYRLDLLNGQLNTSASNLLELGPQCAVVADTLSGQSFINGPVKKRGLVHNDFVFPVGKAGRMRWVALQNASGDFTVEYINNNPYSLGSMMGTGLDHISHLEYWTILESGMSGNAATKLSFEDPGSGGVTNLSDLRVARFDGSAWQNAGNTSVGGSPGADGWVSSIAENGFSAGRQYFALASAIGQENPLPLTRIVLRAGKTMGRVRIDWTEDADARNGIFELQRAGKEKNFETVSQERSKPGMFLYHYDYRSSDDWVAFFRIRKIDDETGAVHFSNVVPFDPLSENEYRISKGGLAGGMLLITMKAPAEKPISMLIYSSSGGLLKRSSGRTVKGSMEQLLNIGELPPGMYYLVGIGQEIKTNTIKFLKP